MYQNRRRQPGMGLMLLFYQLFGVIGIENIPPVTLGCIGLQVAIFLRLFKLPWHDASQVCISVYNVWRKRQYIRLLYGALEHGDDWHLYYNMFSFALKGQSLERRYGSKKFLYILSVFTVLTSAVLVALNALASEHFGFNERECAIGFSGVIFALKVLTTYYNSNHTSMIMGMPIIVPAKYAVWVELVLIQVMVPNASFFGHLSGILVGLAYVTGVLKSILDLLYSMVAGIFKIFTRPHFTPNTERSGYVNNNYGSGYANNNFRTDHANNFNAFVPPGMSEEEQLKRAMEESVQESFQQGFNSSPSYPDAHNTERSFPPPPPPGFIFEERHSQPPPAGFAPEIEEIRRRRTERFFS